MAVLGRYVQTPDERKRYTIDYSEWLDDAETITAITFTSEQITDLSAAPPVVIDKQINSPAYTVTIWISGGVDGARYKIIVHATTNGSQRKDDEIKFDVRAL